MDNTEQFDLLVKLASKERLYSFLYHTDKEIGIKLGNNLDIVLVCIDNKVMLLSQAFTKWDSLDSQSILDFEIDTMPQSANMLQWVSYRWDY